MSETLQDIQADYGYLLDSKLFESTEEETIDNEELRHFEDMEKEVQKEFENLA